MANSNFDEVLKALKNVLSLNQIQDLKVFEDGSISLKVLSPLSPSSAEAESLLLKVKQAAQSVDGIKEVRAFIERPNPNSANSAGASHGNANSIARGIPGIKTIIAVSSGKGGVGKSTVSVNLASALAQAGYAVGLLDADIYGPNIPTMMGVTENPKLIQDPMRGELFIPPSSHGVKVMSMGFLIQGDQPVIWRGPMLHNILNQFCTKVEWGNLDYLVLDLPPGTGDVQLSLAQMIPLAGTVIVTTPQEISLQDVRKAMNMWEKVKVPVIGIVENMAYFTGDDGKKYAIFGEGGGELLAKKFNSQVLAQMPLVPAIRQGGDEGKPIVVRSPESESGKNFQQLASRVVDRLKQIHSSAAAGLEIGQF
jgi:ATP-binding protein involved in chromosome partitioning